MPNVEPLDRANLAAFEDYFRRRDDTVGFVPNSFLTMGRRPDLLRGFIQIVEGAYLGGTVDPALKRLVALMRSSAAGCRYCQAHTATHATQAGVEARKLQALWDFEHDEAFSEAERAALRLARDAAVLPNAVTEEHFADLRRYFTDDEIVEIVGVVCVFAFINSWNDTMATELEEEPLAVGAQRLRPGGWEPGKHAPVGAAAERGSP